TARSLIAGLDRTAFALAVSASSAGSPPPTPDALPAARQALPGGIGYPQGSGERFPPRFLLSQPIRTQERPSSAAGPAGEASTLGKPSCRPRLLQRLVRRRYLPAFFDAPNTSLARWKNHCSIPGNSGLDVQVEASNDHK